MSGDRWTGYCEWMRKVSDGTRVRCQNQGIRCGPEGEKLCRIHRHMAEGRPWPMHNPIPKEDQCGA